MSGAARVFTLKYSWLCLLCVADFLVAFALAFTQAGCDLPLTLRSVVRPFADGGLAVAFRHTAGDIALLAALRMLLLVCLAATRRPIRNLQFVALLRFRRPALPVSVSPVSATDNVRCRH